MWITEVPIIAMAATAMPMMTVNHSPTRLVTGPMRNAWLTAKPMPKAPSARPISALEKFSTSIVKKFQTDGKDWLPRVKSPSDASSHSTTGLRLSDQSAPNGLARRMSNLRRRLSGRLSGSTKRPNRKLAPAKKAAA